MKLRTLLFAPGDSPRKMAKAIQSAADCVILDLEDSVAPDAKTAARAGVTTTLPLVRPVAVRINPRGSPWYLDDLAAVAQCRPAAILLPKCTGAEDLAALDHHLEALETAFGLARRGIGVLALATETAGSLRRMDYAGSPRLLALCFGAEDLAADFGIAPRVAGAYPAVIAAARSATLVAAAQAGVPAIDTPFPDPRDAAGLAAEAAQAAADGFAGKLCIHPAQLETVAAAFTPAADRIDWARRVTAAFAAQPGAGVLSLDGTMIDQPHLKLAKRILASI